MADTLVPNNVLDFVTGIHGNRANLAKRKEEIFNKAYASAYKDMATHTVAYTASGEEYTGKTTAEKNSKRCNKNREKIQQALKDYIGSLFSGLLKKTTQKDFDDWHMKSCDAIVSIYIFVKDLEDSSGIIKSENFSDLICHKDSSIKTTFTYGQAQKLLNMMLKYLYCYYKCEGLTDYDAIVRFFHVPVDRNVLQEALGSDDYHGIPWSKIKGYSDYWKCKGEIEIYVKKQTIYPTAFMWELTEWPFK